ncbi:MAG: hypothetical protein WAL88_07560 [Nitrosotalea sp.]
MQGEPFADIIGTLLTIIGDNGLRLAQGIAYAILANSILITTGLFIQYKLFNKNLRLVCDLDEQMDDTFYNLSRSYRKYFLLALSSNCLIIFAEFLGLTNGSGTTNPFGLILFFSGLTMQLKFYELLLRRIDNLEERFYNFIPLLNARYSDDLGLIVISLFGLFVASYSFEFSSTNHLWFYVGIVVLTLSLALQYKVSKTIFRRIKDLEGIWRIYQNCNKLPIDSRKSLKKYLNEICEAYVISNYLKKKYKISDLEDLPSSLKH